MVLKLLDYMIEGNNYIVIIGGSQSHIPFTNKAKDKGFSTVVLDGNPNCPCANIADKFFSISTHDIDQIITNFSICFYIDLIVLRTMFKN